MGYLVWDVLRKGIWSSVCGGWHYDPSSSTFANTFHLYLFIFLLCFPFSVYVYLPKNLLNWTVYTAIVGVLFFTIKFVNISLHRMFDSSECVVEEQFPGNVSSDSDKRKSNSKADTREEEGIELQVLCTDKKRESSRGEDIINTESAVFEDFNSVNLREVESLVPCGTIDLKVDVHRKNSSDSDETSTKNGVLSIVDEVNIPNTSNEKSNELRTTVTTSEEVLIEKGKRNLSLKENTSQNTSDAVDSVEDNARLSERSRQYSVSVTLGEGSAEKTITDPTPARSMQLNNEYEVDTNKSLLFWKEKWDRANPRSYRPRMNGICGADIRHPNACLRSSSPLSMYTSDIVYPIAEDKDEQQYTGLVRSVQSDDDDEDDEVYLQRPADEEDDYGDIEDLDVEIDASSSPLLVSKRLNNQRDYVSSSGCNQPSNRIRGYVDSLTRKYKKNGKSVSKNLQNQANNKDREENPSRETSTECSEMVEVDQSIEDGERKLGKESELSDEIRKSSDIDDVLKQLDDLKSQYPEMLEGRSRFPSAPTLITGRRDKSAGHSRERSGTCSQLEINTDSSSGRKASLPEGTVSDSTSGDVFSSGMENANVRPSESNEASSSGSNNELSTLLPPPYNTPSNSPSSVNVYHGHRPALRFDNNRSRHHPLNARRCRSSALEGIPSPSVFRLGTNRDISSELSNFILRRSHSRESNNTHIATSYDDTTDGAVHMFQDEDGKWMSYTFDKHGSGVAANLPPPTARRKESALNPIEEQKNIARTSSGMDDCTTFVNSNLRQASNESSVTTASTSTALVANSSSDPVSSTDLYQLREAENGLVRLEVVDYLVPLPPPLPISHNSAFISPTFPSLRFNPLTGLYSGSGTSHRELQYDYPGLQRGGRFEYDHIEVLEYDKRKRRYYKFSMFPFSGVKIYFDRLSLDALLDFNETFWESLICIVLAIVVSSLGAVILHLSFYHDISAFLFCFVMATSHYSLLKSVQPDASSPVHGFNKIVAYSRPVYFIFCCSLIIGVHYLLKTDISWMIFRLYNKEYNPYVLLQFTCDFLQTFILFFPIFFTMGMFPQINTFAMYVFEQIDMHMFGGSAVISLKSAIYCVFRSIFVVLLLFGFAYGALNEEKSSQHLLFSIFIALLIMFAYHLSRCACDPTPIWNILVKQLFPVEEIGKPSNEMDKLKPDKKTKDKRPKKKTSIVYGKDIKCDSRDIKQARLRVSVSSQQSGRSVSFSEKKTIIEELENVDDTISESLQRTVNSRLQSDLIVSCFAGILLFSIHRSTIFTLLQPDLNPIMWGVAVGLGFLLHYIMPQMRKQLPWLCIARPVLRSLEHEQFEAQAPATVTWFEKVYLYLGFFEKNIIYPVMFIGCITCGASDLKRRAGPLASSIILTVCSLKCLRLSFSHIHCQYLILAFTVLLFQLNLTSETFVVDYFFISILYYKIYDLLLKLKFVLTYIAPWQITWGSAFHAFAQPFSLPHSAIMFAQAALSSLLSSPLYPFLGSAIFLTSYPRPMKFWERDYNTRRVDHSNTKMASHLEKNLGADDNNLNSIFYEHLTRSLQCSLCGDLLMGRWGEVSAGDCFILASDYLNCLIHIVELANGLVTFQMRGLEFRGTYCQQREVEAITDGVEENDRCCCCKPGHLPYMLSLNAAFSQRWLAWEVISGKYILEGYSISDNPAGSMLQVFDFRKMLISYYVKSIIYFAVINPKLEEWIDSSSIRDALKAMIDKNFVDLDPVFNVNIDEDFDFRYSGITRNSFCSSYVNWIRYCNSQRKKPVANTQRDSPLVTLCFALSLLGRRALGTASHNTAASVEYFLYGVHTLFKGDFRIASVRDEWVFADMELLRKVVAPAIRMSLKLHQDHFMAPDEYECHPALFAAISSHQDNIVISHEGDPAWRKAVLSGKPSLLAFRRVMDEGSDDYKIIMLSKRYLSFRVIKLNRECVRGLWAGQQQELVFLRNLNPERGSIQNAKQALRNIINSSCDQPIGYPIFVSPLTTSYAETNVQYTSYLGGTVSINGIKNLIFNFCRRVRKRCVEGCSSGSSAPSQDDGGFGHEGNFVMTTFNHHSTASHQSMETSLTGSGGTITRVSTGSGVGCRLAPSHAGTSKPAFGKLPSLLSPPGGNSPLPEALKSQDRKSADKEEEEKEPILHRVKIVDPGQVHDGINQGRLIDVIWPDEVMRQKGGRNFWKDWVPETGMEGQVVHSWIPNHPNPNRRSTFDRTILLIKIDDKYVPISETGVQDLGAEV